MAYRDESGTHQSDVRRETVLLGLVEVPVVNHHVSRIVFQRSRPSVFVLIPQLLHADVYSKRTYRFGKTKEDDRGIKTLGLCGVCVYTVV